MKTIFINEDEEKFLRESVLRDALPFDISSAIYMNKTSFGKNDAFPDVLDSDFIYSKSAKRFEELKQNLKDIHEINNVKSTDLRQALGELIIQCSEKEKPYRNQLEKICFNILVDLLHIPSESISLDVKLVDKIDLNDDSILLDPINGKEELSISDLEDNGKLKKEVNKRKVINALCMGAGMRMSSLKRFYEDDINAIDPELCDLYHKIICLNEYLLFTKEDLGISDSNKMQMGTSLVKIGEEDTLPKVSAQGKIFPVLLCEGIRGLFELFSTHGLPSDREKASAILGRADYLKAEPWEMRIGPALWDLLSDTFVDVDSLSLPYLFKRISSLKVDKFNYLMKAIFSNSKRGREIMQYLSKKARNDSEYDRFVSKMTKMKKDKGIISDDYIREDEL